MNKQRIVKAVALVIAGLWVTAASAAVEIKFKARISSSPLRSRDRAQALPRGAAGLRVYHGKGGTAARVCLYPRRHPMLGDPSCRSASDPSASAR